MSQIRRLRLSDRLFFVTVNLRRQVHPLVASEYPLLIEALEAARRRLGFLLYGDVLMPDHWHALIWTGYPLTISQAIHDVKKVSARQLHRQRGTQGPVWRHQFWDRFVRHAREFNDRLEYMHLGCCKRPRRRCPLRMLVRWDCRRRAAGPQHRY